MTPPTDTTPKKWGRPDRDIHSQGKNDHDSDDRDADELLT